MYDDGYKAITNIDISGTVIAQMQSKCDPEKFKGLDCELWPVTARERRAHCGAPMQGKSWMSWT